jgi:ATP/ADP translocase
MNTNNWIRQFHRWVSIAFTVAVIINIIALVRKDQAVWIGILALVPLILLLVTGLYLFALPYVSRWRGAGAPQVNSSCPQSQSVPT